MLIKILIRYIIGYVKVVIEGYYTERFVNICKSKKILIWNLKRKNGIELYLNIGINDFKKLSSVARKTKCKVKIEKKCGLPFILHKYKKRKIFVLLLIIVCASIYFSSNYVWNIEVQEENGEEVQNIIQDLQTAGLNVGMLKSKVDTKDVINKVRLNRQDIAWMGIELKGTNAIVKIVKADEAPEIVDESDYCNIVANKSGLITKINATSGTAMVKVGDVVQQGSILISGTMEGKYTDTRLVHSSGEIEAKVWYTKSKEIYFNQEEYTETGNQEIQYGIKINNFKINLPKGVSKFEICDTIYTEENLKLFSNLYLPISITKTIKKEKVKTEKNYTVEEATAVGIEELEKELESEIENPQNILRKDI